MSEPEQTADDRTRVFRAPDDTPDAAPRTTPPADPADQQATAVHPVAPTARHDTAPEPVRSVAAADGPGYGVDRPAPETWRPPVDPATTAPAWSTKPVAVRRADTFGALCLLLAGVAAALSLVLPWTPQGPTGLDLARDVVDQAGTDWTGLFDRGLWQPGAVLAGGAVLFVLGLLLLVPARAHRTLGVLALVVAGVVVAAVLVPAHARDWQLADFDLGYFFALGVAGLGLLGALKALLTGPKVR
ncbi:hypothetical protein SAMN05660199_01835 [Klenkia soli]|uniref:Uncharacterized protein n=1 Tax=Klenkia soli TaxID=1052260 RepID=A0A1H0J1S1_9ACTN|nr:hypothetical protein [Klenkia soli]SDO37420.1 hypothetical protein SAMN05660199_01835 [Klenkia soli]